MFRTRLTHSLEVAQIARTVARALNLNEDLTEAIALAHDLGHTPFGHAGQTALNACMKSYVGFEHNRQSLRVVEHLEMRYPEFQGLNLLFESSEGILKHCNIDQAASLGPLGQRFLDQTQPSLEAQLTNVADEIAYNHHDIDDGLRANLLNLEQMLEFPLFCKLHKAAQRRWQKTGPKQILHSVIREMLNHFVVDLIRSTQSRLLQIAPQDIAHVRSLRDPIIEFSTAVRAEHLALKRLLRHQLYQHEQVLNNANRAAVVVKELFNRFFSDPDSLPPEHRISDTRNENRHAQTIADYVAGMTDRFAIAEHKRIFHCNRFADL
jgi:dGTPase